MQQLLHLVGFISLLNMMHGTTNIKFCRVNRSKVSRPALNKESEDGAHTVRTLPQNRSAVDHVFQMEKTNNSNTILTKKPT